MWPRGARRAKANGRRLAHAGSRLKPTDVFGRPRLISQPSSRTRENRLYGMIGGIEETSASFEARSAPRSYPTEGFSDACVTTLSARADGRRTKSANGRNRERWGDYGAAGSTRV